jgi:hypothetical protein
LPVATSAAIAPVSTSGTQLYYRFLGARNALRDQCNVATILSVSPSISGTSGVTSVTPCRGQIPLQTSVRKRPAK